MKPSAWSRELKNQDTIAEIQGYEGDNAFYRGDDDSAGRYYNEARKTAAHSSDLTLTLLGKINLAKLALKQGKSSTALSSLTNLSAKADSMGLKYSSVECSLYHAEALMNMKQLEPARKELEVALSRSQKLGRVSLIPRSEYLLARDFEMAGNSSEASEHYKETRKILISIQQEAKSDRISKRSDLRPIYAHAVN